MNVYTTDKIRNVVYWDMGVLERQQWLRQWLICPELPIVWEMSQMAIPSVIMIKKRSNVVFLSDFCSPDRVERDKDQSAGYSRIFRFCR